MEALKKWIETIRTMHATLVEKHGVFPMLLFYVTVIAAGIGTVNSVRLRQSQHEITRLMAERHLVSKGLADTLTLAAKEMASKTATLDAVNTRAAMQRLEAHQNEYASRLNAVVTQVSVLQSKEAARQASDTHQPGDDQPTRVADKETPVIAVSSPTARRRWYYLWLR